MDKVIVVRIGSPAEHLDSWVNQGKWSTPENPNMIDNQIVRDLFVQGYNVYIVFLESGDIPVYTALVTNVRGRNHLDVQYPLGNDHGLFETFIEFNSIFPIPNGVRPLYRPLLDYVRYTRGQQLPINELLSEVPIAVYRSLQTVNNIYINNDIWSNRTVINPEYNLYQG